MSRHYFNRRSVRTVALLLVPVLLFVQGLRLHAHAHAHDDPAHTADHTHTSPIHPESTLGTAADHDESVTDVNVSLAVLIKVLYSALALAMVSAFLLLMPAPRRLVQRFPPPALWFRPSAVYSLTPPLRAPPR